MKKSDWRDTYDRLLPFFQDAARTYYNEGDTERGFKFWAVSEVLTDTDLSDDEIKDAPRLDSGGDLSLDACFEDAEASTLVLVQSKFHADAVAVGNGEIGKFLGCLDRVLNPKVVVESRNPLIADAHRAVREAISKGWTLRFVFVTSGYLSPEGKVFAEENVEVAQFVDGVKIQCELDVYDLERLRQLYESHLSPGRFSTDVTLNIAKKERVSSKIAGFNVLIAAIPGAELVKAFRQHKYGLFRLNPRGPLQNRVRSDILETLKDANKRKLFFHLNNGITAVCDGFKELDSERVEIRDFQIVNGCQTTVTLARASAIVESDPDIKVLLRIIEGLSGLRDDVATATNTQARLTAQDFKSNDPRQRNLKNEFNAMAAPIFYEIKRGDWDMEDNKQRYLDQVAGVNRRLKMKDLGQATLAFLGDPGDAKDKSRKVFEDAQTYERVFPEGIRAQQLLLPWEIYLQAEALCAAWKEFGGASYARFCLVAIAGEELCPKHQLPSAPDASRMREKPETVLRALKRGQDAISGVLATFGEGEFPGYREFFRSADHFGKVLRTYKALPKSS